MATRISVKLRICDNESGSGHESITIRPEGDCKLCHEVAMCLAQVAMYFIESHDADKDKFIEDFKSYLTFDDERGAE